MGTESKYRDYFSDSALMADYALYQQKYATRLRESDKVLLDQVVRAVEEINRDSVVAVLDLGCSTGNFLLHLKHRAPELRLFGADMAPEVIAGCRDNPELEGVEFLQLDAAAMGRDAEFHVIIANAILGGLDEESFDAALGGVARALKDGGCLLVFDWLNPFQQELNITEISRGCPDGLTWWVRSYARIESVLTRLGFGKPEFRPFHVPIDLEMPADAGSVQTYTVPTERGRLSFRGAFCQPWCHLKARKLAPS